MYNRKRIISSYTLPEKEAIHLATYDPDVLPVGSFSYSSQKYPGDIDIQERIKVMDNIITDAGIPDVIQEAESLKHATKIIADDIKKIIRKLKDKRGYYFADFKAGLYSNGDGIHWTKDEIKMGKKLVVDPVTCNQKILKLSDALFNGVVKLDLWAPINGRYIEVTNFIIPTLVKDGKEFNLNGEQPDYISSIAKDVIDYYNVGNYFKSDKRLWLLAAYFGDDDLLAKITPILNSGAGILYQVVGDVGTLMLMLDRLKSPPVGSILDEIDEFKSRISKTDLDNNTLNNFNECIDIIYSDIKNKEFKEASDMLAHLGIAVSDKLNAITIYLNEKNSVDPIGYIRNIL
jgi:cell division protein ZapA (FtsZ GTPase activity inhibitor)